MIECMYWLRCNRENVALSDIAGVIMQDWPESYVSTLKTIGQHGISPDGW